MFSPEFLLYYGVIFSLVLNLGTESRSRWFLPRIFEVRDAFWFYFLLVLIFGFSIFKCICQIAFFDLINYSIFSSPGSSCRMFHTPKWVAFSFLNIFWATPVRLTVLLPQKLGSRPVTTSTRWYIIGISYASQDQILPFRCRSRILIFSLAAFSFELVVMWTFLLLLILCWLLQWWSRGIYSVSSVTSSLEQLLKMYSITHVWEY